MKKSRSAANRSPMRSPASTSSAPARSSASSFDTRGAVTFGQITSANVGQRFAIVLDNQVITAPVIQQPITGGSGQISGSFTTQSANDLAVLLRAGALPASLDIVEERSVEPSLGADSIRSGLTAGVVAGVLVVAFMVVAYGLFGVFANISLVLNIVLIFGVAVAARRHADAAGHRRYRSDHRHGGGRQRADLRAHPRGAEGRHVATCRRSMPVSSGPGAPLSTRT